MAEDYWRLGSVGNHILDVLVFNNVTKLSTYQYLRQGGVGKEEEFGVLMGFLMATVFLSMMILSIRLEVDNIKHGDGSSLFLRLKGFFSRNNPGSSQQSHDIESAQDENGEGGEAIMEYKIKIIRGLVLLGILVAIMISLPFITSTRIVTYRMLLFIFMFTFFALFPLIFIFHHDHMKQMALAHLSAMMICFRN